MASLRPIFGKKRGAGPGLRDGLSIYSGETVADKMRRNFGNAELSVRAFNDVRSPIAAGVPLLSQAVAGIIRLYLEFLNRGYLKNG